jgi:excisionase family DNA binding protein
MWLHTPHELLGRYNATVVFQHPGGSVVETAKPAFLRVREAAPILGISPSALYELANVWLATGGRSGVPAVRLGRSIRIPRAAIDRLAAVGSESDLEEGFVR